MTLNVVIYFDYLCPFAYRVTKFFTTMKRHRPEMQLTWRHFSLEQVNAVRKGKPDDWYLWEQPLDYQGTGRRQSARMLRAFLASHAASLQSDLLWANFRLGLYDAYHMDEADLSNPVVILNVARQSGLDMLSFEQHWQSDAARARLKSDHLQGLDDEVFGVPTLIVNDAVPTYLRLSQHPPEADHQTFFDELIHQLTQRPYLNEFKRVHR